MNKKLISILVILSMLAFLLTSAFSAPRVTSVSLVSVAFREEKGVTFKFRVDGFKTQDLKGSVVVDGQTLKLRCGHSGDSTDLLVCISEKATAARFSGHKAVVLLEGYSFWFSIPVHHI